MPLFLHPPSHPCSRLLVHCRVPVHIIQQQPVGTNLCEGSGRQKVFIAMEQYGVTARERLIVFLLDLLTTVFHYQEISRRSCFVRKVE